jgi:hypothetical protein
MAFVIAALLVVFGAFASAREASSAPNAHTLACPTPPTSIQDFLKKMDLWLGCEWPRGDQADEAIKAVRASLLNRRSSFSGSARLWLDRTIDRLNVALDASRLSAGVRLKNTETGDLAMRAMRIAMGRLYWANATLREGTRYERTGIAAAMWYIAAGRFNVVWNAGGDEQKLWEAEIHLHAGNADFIAGGITNSGGRRIRSTLRYWGAWKRLLGQPPA